MKTGPEYPRVAHLCAAPEWGEAQARLLALLVSRQALGQFLVLAAPPGGELARRARRAGLRVLDLENRADARRQLELDLREYDLTRIEAHDPEALPEGRRLRRRLRVALTPPPGARPGWLARRFGAALRRGT